MKLGKRSIVLILIALYAGAVWLRLDGPDQSIYPYYSGDSGTNFRHAQTIANDGRLPLIDERAARPEGYSPSRAKPNGVEYFAGYAYRLVRPFTDLSDKRFSGILTVFVFSLSVFTMYALTRRVWGCQAAGGIAALLVAFLAPLVDVTNGREFFHAPYAFVVVSLHLALFASGAARGSASRLALCALTAFALFGVWESAPIYVAAFGLAVLVLPGITPQTRRWTIASHLAAAFVAGIVFPHLRAGRFLLAWPTVWLLVATAHSFFRDRLPRRVPGWACLVGAFIILTLIAGLFRRGASEPFDPLAYWYYRLRFTGGKPEDPALLPAVARIVWNRDHAPPSARLLLEFFLPLLCFLVPALTVVRGAKREKGISLWSYLVLVGAGTAVFLLDRAAVFSAALFASPFVAGAMKGFGKNVRTRAVPVAVALGLVAVSIPPVTSKIDMIGLLGERFHLTPGSTEGFVWASIGNADRELVRAIATGTSTRNDVVLAAPGISSVIATFAGRSTVIVPGVHSDAMVDKTVDVLSGFYAGENDLSARCSAFGVTHVVYSIDLLLDESVHSPRYVSGATGEIEGTLAYKMHFAPETLRRFQLVYENDNYRLFRVTADTEPVFLSDHPPVYQRDIFRSSGSDIRVFYSRIVDILATYDTAVDAQARGDEAGAIRRFAYCLEQAPYFTAARLGTGDSLLRLGNPREAYGSYSSVLQYAPDNTHALYYGALSLAYTGRRDEAIILVELLLTATGDRQIRTEALELKSALEAGRPVDMPGPRPTDDAK